MYGRQFVERNGVIWMVGSEACLHQPLKLLCIDLGGRVVSARVMILKDLVDRLDVARLGRCGRRECSERQECKDRDKSGLAAGSRYNDFIPRHLSHGGGTIHGRKYGRKVPTKARSKNTGVPMTLGLFFSLPHALGSNLAAVTNIAADPPSGSLGDSGVGQLVQAIAGFGGGSGAADFLNGAPVGADTSQQSFLTTPHP